MNDDIISDIHNHGIDINNRHIYLHGHTQSVAEQDPGVDYRMASSFIKNIRILDSISNLPVLIHMHSIGGNWADGMAIYDAIYSCKSYVTIVVYGQAESMSSIILQSADKRIMMPNSYFMLHYGSIGYHANYLDAKNAMDFEKRCIETMMDIYTSVFLKSKYYKESIKPQTERKAKAFLNRKLKEGDWYLNANEAVYYGFADGVLTTRNYKSIDTL